MVDVDIPIWNRDMADSWVTNEHICDAKLKLYCKKNGITYEKIVPDASPQNGVSERSNWTVESMTRAFLLDGDVSNYFWPFAAQSAVHIKVRVLHSAIEVGKTPFELIMGKKPDLSHLRPFGCVVTAR